MKFSCQCGHVIRDQTDYLPYKATILRDEDDSGFWDAVDVEGDADSAKRQTEPVTSLRVLDTWATLTSSAYECDECGRLYLERERGGGFVVFQPESGRPEHILHSSRGSSVRAP